MTRLLSLAAGTILDVGPAEAVSVAADTGWPAVGLWFDPDSWTDAVSRDVRTRLADTGVTALDIEPVILSADGDPGERLIDAAAAVGARNVLVASRHPDPMITVERFGTLCDRAADAGITVVLEFLPIFAVRNLAEAQHVVASAARPNSGVLVDSLHLARSGGAPADLTAGGGAVRYPYLQIADAPIAAVDTSLRGLRVEALDGRLLPGHGGLPLDALLHHAPGVPLSFELRSAALRTAYPDPHERSRIVLDAWITAGLR